MNPPQQDRPKIEYRQDLDFNGLENVTTSKCKMSIMKEFKVICGLKTPALT